MAAFAKALLVFRFGLVVLHHLRHPHHGLATAEEVRGVVGVRAEKDQVVEGILDFVGITFGNAVLVNIECQRILEAEFERLPILLQEIHVAGEFDVAQHP